MLLLVQHQWKTLTLLPVCFHLTSTRRDVIQVLTQSATGVSEMRK